jgi:hypothetical protein
MYVKLVPDYTVALAYYLKKTIKNSNKMQKKKNHSILPFCFLAIEFCTISPREQNGPLLNGIFNLLLSLPMSHLQLPALEWNLHNCHTEQ